MTRKSMSIKEFNQKFLTGEIKETFIKVRENNLINLECNVCGSHVQQQDPEIASTITKNCKTFMWKTICDCCGIHQSRRTILAPYGWNDDATTKKR